MLTPSADLVGELRSLAESAAVAGGAAALSCVEQGDISASTKTTGLDIVTDADHASQRAIIATIESARPGDGYVTEEGEQRDSTTGVTWIVDPVDSTANLARDLPVWSVSVAACREDGTGIAGAVHAPRIGDLFSGGKGLGVLAGGAPVPRRPDAPSLGTAMGLIGWQSGQRHRHLGTTLVSLIAATGRLRSPGSPALGLAWTATGSADFAYYEQRLYEWDIAAGLLLCREAGLEIRMDRAPSGPHKLLVAQPRHFDELAGVVFG